MPPDSIIYHVLSKTLFAICLQTEGGATIGMGRLVGDGGLQVFITDFIVNRDWQNREFGSEIMRLLVEYIETSMAPGTFVGLFFALGRERF